LFCLAFFLSLRFVFCFCILNDLIIIRMLLRIHQLVITVHWLMNLISLSPFQSCGGASLFHGDWLVLLISDIIVVDLVRILLARCRLLNNFGVRDNVLVYLSSDALRFTLRSHVFKLLWVLLILTILLIVLAFLGFKLIFIAGISKLLCVLLFINSHRSLKIIFVLPRIT